ncbi:MAG: NAD(P)H-hydrate dehydratase [Candidatus Diapherotrites archaeon]|nr:NAD(P)H-hydrate dehydratase [Candidatus Diapherotrites archaeon]
MRFISNYDMKLFERFANQFGISNKTLMENAGKAIVNEIETTVGKKVRFFVLCGVGNNGGDGLTTARILKEHGYEVYVYLIGEPKTEEAKEAYKKLLSKYKNVFVSEAFLDRLNEKYIIIDAIFGTGFRGKVDGKIKKIIEKINKIKAKKICIDIPSGFDKNCIDNNYVLPDKILCLHAAKKGLEGFSRKIKILDIGIPKEVELVITSDHVRKMLKERETNSYKGQNGKILIIAGSEKYPGSAILCYNASKACFRTGVDLVKIFTVAKVGWLINLKLPEAITTKIDCDFLKYDHIEEALDLAKSSDVILIGPGIGENKETKIFVKEIIEKIKDKKTIVDADGIKALAGIKLNKNVLITPHKRELEIFSDREIPMEITSRARITKEIAKKQNCNILLKGPIDIITNGKEISFNATGNPAMTTAGTGDVLAGLCAAFATNNSLIKSAEAAAYINGYCGDMLYEEKNYGILASDIIEKIPEVINNIKVSK